MSHTLSTIAGYTLVSFCEHGTYSAREYIRQKKVSINLKRMRIQCMFSTITDFN